MRLTFRAKLMAIVAVAALAFVLLILATRVIARRVDKQLATIQGRYLPKVVLKPELDAALEKLRRGFQDAVAAHDAEGLAATRPLKQRFLSRLDAAEEVLNPVDVAALRVALEDYDATAYDVSRRLIGDETGEALVDEMAVMQAKQQRVSSSLEKVAAFDGRELSTAFAAAAAADTDAQKYELWISLACMTSVVVLSMGISRSLLRSVAELTAGFERFGASRFDAPILVSSRDELGDLASHANEMARKLERYTEEQKRSEAKFRALLEAAPDAMVIAGDDGRVTLVNAQAEKLFGYTREELVGRDVEMLLPERERGKDKEKPPGHLRDPAKGLDAELFGRRKDGSEFPIEIRQSPLETDEGAVVSTAIRDVTDRMRIEAELKLSNRELEAFSYSVAHDLRAPLRGINGLSRALLEDSSDKLDEQSQDYLKRIGAGSERMGLLIDALLALSRVSRVELTREVVPLARLADAVMKQLRTGQPERVVEFVNQEGVVSNGDPALLRALLDNLLGNAWKFTGARADARISFGSEKKDEAIVYYVRDNGAGFDMAYADKLFTPFQRLHKASEFAGTGIGLATVQRIVRRHGGEIWAEGAVGHGATFYFTLSRSPGATYS